ncbi:hypothetical protein K469DRAFT_721851 [Zopfia rhizophila CBS 207.26]|uniref:BZIP domain-containing protein n=1 Tax=Zopfia rhizophila CBS 207.26 TaxID=1314779 RepID=A0A6A6DF62_9PEZI|nr:hypothetical protein K469DRAFT_721851 [Zopfia rhizophila CBS 207.26]
MNLTNKACPKSSTKTKAADLQRIRNNQRRSRARRKDYIAELEEKVRRYESSGSQTVTNPEFKQLIKENELLKRLLHSIGLGHDFLKAYTKASEVALEISQPAAQLDDNGCCQNRECSSSDNMQDNSIPSATLEMQPPSPFPGANYRLDTEVPTQGLFQIQQNPLQTEHFLPWEFSFDFSNLPHDSSEPVQNQTQSYGSQIAIRSVGDGSITEASENFMSPENTTLCSLAFSLIMNRARPSTACWIQVWLSIIRRLSYREQGPIQYTCGNIVDGIRQFPTFKERSWSRLRHLLRRRVCHRRVDSSFAACGAVSFFTYQNS